MRLFSRNVIPRRPTSIVIRPSSIVRRPSSVVVVRRPSSVVRRPSSVVRRPSSVVRRPSSVVRRPSSVVRRPSSVVRRPSSLVPRPSSLVPRPSSLVPRPSSLVPRSSYSLKNSSLFFDINYLYNLALSSVQYGNHWLKSVDIIMNCQLTHAPMISVTSSYCTCDGSFARVQFMTKTIRATAYRPTDNRRHAIIVLSYIIRVGKCM